MKKNQQGFTLIEILVVIGLIAILAAVVIIAINPARQFAQGRNSQRVSNVQTILNAIGQKLADDKGVFKDCLTNIPTVTTSPVPNPITTAVVGAKKIANGSGNADLSCLVPTYIPTSLPYDPSDADAKWNSATDYSTEYFVVQDSGRVTVYADNVESSLSQVNFVSLTR